MKNLSIYIEKNGQGIFDATGIIGHAEKDSIIRNCTIDETSEFAATRTYTYLGGICGWSEGVIENCESKARITFSWSDSTCFLNPYHLAIGGVCGSNDGVIENCISYATIKATGATHLGGICGYDQRRKLSEVLPADGCAEFHGLYDS